MNLTNDTELANTQTKLALLEARYDLLWRNASEDEELRNETVEDEHIRQVTMRSLKRYINQFTEEIARYEAHHAAQR